jgi:cytidylate kinase
MNKLLIGLLIVVGLSACGKETSCERYASKFNCEYVEKQATYEVYYWKDVFKGNDQDEKYVGTAVGLSQCRDTAIYAHRTEMRYRERNWNNWSNSDDNWSERSYICVLVKDGHRLEKHRK